jgi:hypothetical protein
MAGWLSRALGFNASRPKPAPAPPARPVPDTSLNRWAVIDENSDLSGWPDPPTADQALARLREKQGLAPGEPVVLYTEQGVPDTSLTRWAVIDENSDLSGWPDPPIQPTAEQVLARLREKQGLAPGEPVVLYTEQGPQQPPAGGLLGSLRSDSAAQGARSSGMSARGEGPLSSRVRQAARKKE